MAEVLDVRILGAELIRQRLERIRETVSKRAVPGALDRAAADLLERSANLAPILTSALIRSGRVRRSRSARRVSRIVSYGTAYAPIVHEQMEPAPGATLKPGPLTRAKPATTDGRPGGRFLERPFRRHADRYRRFVEEAVATSIRRRGR